MYIFFPLKETNKFKWYSNHWPSPNLIWFRFEVDAKKVWDEVCPRQEINHMIRGFWGRILQVIVLLAFLYLYLNFEFAFLYLLKTGDQLLDPRLLKDDIARNGSHYIFSCWWNRWRFAAKTFELVSEKQEGTTFVIHPNHPNHTFAPLPAFHEHKMLMVNQRMAVFWLSKRWSPSAHCSSGHQHPPCGSGPSSVHHRPNHPLTSIITAKVHPLY